jgi:hypothetical protein
MIAQRIRVMVGKAGPAFRVKADVMAGMGVVRCAGGAGVFCFRCKRKVAVFDSLAFRQLLEIAEAHRCPPPKEETP